MNIINNAHIRVNSNKAPYKIWFGKPSSFKHFRIFGRKCYINKNYDKLGKLESRADEKILLGYSSRSKGYKLCSERLQNIFEWIDVVFDEESTGRRKEEPTNDQPLPTTS